MKKMLALAIFGACAAVGGSAFAADAPKATAAAAAAPTNPVCEAQATEKKLAGAAKTSFLKKCVNDAKDAANKTCTTQAEDKKLAGAAKTSFVNKCVKDAAAAKAPPA